MDKTNYSLLSALYDNENANLYNEIYFPIIRYSLFYLIEEKSSSEGYSTVDALQTIIIERFDISIPTSVLMGAIRAIGNNTSETELKIFENGSSFRVTHMWDSDKCQSIEERAKKYDNKIQEIETKFQEFIQLEEISCKTTFKEFFSNHTSDLLDYLNDNRKSDNLETRDSGTDAQLANLMQFVLVLKEQDPNLYQIAETFFWSSVVAAFLQRDQNILKDSRGVTHYYFDTSLAMSFLDLAYPEDHAYAKDLKNMIEEAGHVACIHPMTIREMKSIIDSSINESGPAIGTRIFDAYHRRKLTNTQLQQIKVGLKTQLSNAGFSIASCTESELDNQEGSYRSSEKVIKLGELRNNVKKAKGEFREIHDVFMADFIKGKRKILAPLSSNGGAERVFFLTSNSQLVDFYYLPSLKDQLMINPRRLIADLWINGALSKQLKLTGLSEAIYRCLAANRVEAHDRMNKIVKCSENYIPDKDERKDFCQKVYRQIVRQSVKVMPVVEDVLTTWDNVKDSESTESSRKMKQKVDIMVQIVNNLNQETEKRVYDLSGRVSALETMTSSQTREIERLRNSDEEKQKQLNNAELKERKQAEELRELKQREKLQTELINNNDQRRLLATQLKELTDQRDSTVSNTPYWGQCCLGLAVLFGALAITVCVINGNIGKLWTLGALALAALLFTGYNQVLSLPFMQIGKKEEMRRKQQDLWDANHPAISRVRHDIEKIDVRNNEIKIEIIKLGDSH